MDYRTISCLVKLLEQFTTWRYYNETRTIAATLNSRDMVDYQMTNAGSILTLIDNTRNVTQFLLIVRLIIVSYAISFNIIAEKDKKALKMMMTTTMMMKMTIKIVTMMV
jgi:hypothetical protein